MVLNRSILVSFLTLFLWQSQAFSSENASVVTEENLSPISSAAPENLHSSPSAKIPPALSVSQQSLVQELLAQATEKKLHEDPQWLRMGHYRRSWSGHYKSPFQGPLFISENGAEDPLQELQESLRLLFTDKQLQCKYPARTKWFQRRLSITADQFALCPEVQAWKAKLGAEELYVVFASSDLSSAGSSFGHTFLRAHNPKNKRSLDLLDYGINFAASTAEDDGALFALKGLFGFYGGAYSMLPFHQKMREYTNLEGRNLWEYKLKLSKDEVDFIIDHLLELGPSSAPYYFLTDNCSLQILELVEIVKPGLDLTARFIDSTIPLDTVKVLNQEKILEGERYRLSLMAEWRTSYNRLDGAQKKSLRQLVKTKDPGVVSSLEKPAQAQVLEAGLRYLAVEDYRQQRESKDEKYKLSVARARLGSVTEPLVMKAPPSPLLSGNSAGYYLGYGGLDGHEFYRFKMRRAFHDLLSNDNGISAFSHLEVLSAEVRYFTSEDRLDLQEFVLLKMFSSAAWDEWSHPLTWRFETGTSPRLAPYLKGAVGVSRDFSFLNSSRISWMVASENSHLLETPQALLGPELLFLTKTKQARALFQAQHLWDARTREWDWQIGAGFSFDINRTEEFRLEYREFRGIPEIMATWMF